MTDEVGHSSEHIEDALDQTSEKQQAVHDMMRQTDGMQDFNANAQTVDSNTKRGAKTIGIPVKVGFRTLRRTAKNVNAKVNPLEQKVNMHDTADHGVESLRLAYRTGKKAVHTVKGTTGTVKAAAKTVKAVKNAPRTIVNAAKNTVRAVVKAAQITANVIVHIGAVIINPITWIVLFFSVVIYVVLGIIVIIMGGANVQQGTYSISYTQQVGIDEADLEEALNFYKIACDRNKGMFSSQINGLYYSDVNLRVSNLVYMERNINGTVTQYTKGFPTSTWKSTLTSAWKITVTEDQAITIAYVYLQMQANQANGTQQQIYQIEYTQDVFNQIVDAAVQWSDTTYANQQCPDNNCSTHIEQHLNPAYTSAQTAYNQAVTAYNQAVEAYNDWVANVTPKSDDFITAETSYNNILELYNRTPAAGKPYIEPSLKAAAAAYNTALAYFRQAVTNWCSVFHYTGLVVNNTLDSDMITILGSVVTSAQTTMNSALATLNSTDQYITSAYPSCDHLHTLHSIGLFIYDKDTVMTELGFTNAEKNWESMIELGMELE